VNRNKKALNITPDFPEAYYVWGEMFLRNQQWESAHQMFHQTIEKDPGYFEAYFQLGELALVTDQLQQAADYYRQTLVIVPDNHLLAERIRESIQLKLKQTQFQNDRSPAISELKKLCLRNKTIKMTSSNKIPIAVIMSG